MTECIDNSNFLPVNCHGKKIPEHIKAAKEFVKLLWGKQGLYIISTYAHTTKVLNSKQTWTAVELFHVQEICKKNNCHFIIEGQKLVIH